MESSARVEFYSGRRSGGLIQVIGSSVEAVLVIQLLFWVVVC